jgi:hypothetical protein
MVVVVSRGDRIRGKATQTIERSCCRFGTAILEGCFAASAEGSVQAVDCLAVRALMAATSAGHREKSGKGFFAYCGNSLPGRGNFVLWIVSLPESPACIVKYVGLLDAFRGLTRLFHRPLATRLPL